MLDRKFATAAGIHANSGIAAMRKQVGWDWHYLLEALAKSECDCPTGFNFKLLCL